MFKNFNFSKKKIKISNANKKYYILDTSFKITPIRDYRFNKTEARLQLLVDNECFPQNDKFKKKNLKLEELINEMGFEWEPLSEPGQMRQMSYATTIMETIEKYAWLIVEQFGNEQNLPVHKISGGELFNYNHPEFKKHVLLVSKNPTLYGASLYNVYINGEKRILRYSACTQKLSVAKGLTLRREDFPVGLFEISKSYRFEEENELQLCRRIRSFHLPELHVLTDSLSSSLKIALAIHLKILEEIKKLDSDYELLCSVTNDFFKENVGFLRNITKSINKPILLAIYNKGLLCEDGVKISIEYKVFDGLNTPVEASTFEVDDGTTDSTFNVKYQLNKDLKKPVSTIHTVFNASVERFAYILLDRAIKMETKSGFRQLPFWVVPIQARVIPYEKFLLKDAKELAEKLNTLNFRTDLDDREIHYSVKKKQKDLKWIPYIITIHKSPIGQQYLSVENKMKGTKRVMSVNDLIKEMKMERDMNITVARYTPMLLSKRLAIQ